MDRMTIFESMQDVSDLVAMATLVVVVLIVSLAVLSVWKALRKLLTRAPIAPERPSHPSPKPRAPERPKNGILVDGSNVMYWSGEPSSMVLRRVISKLKDSGFHPYVVFDASVGYRLADRYLDDGPMATMIELPTDRVVVVHKGQIADEVILQFAKESGYRIVTNDRFRDWSVEYPLVTEKGRLVKGTWREGNVVLRGL